MRTSSLNVQKIYGDFIQDLPPSQEYLILSFSPGSIPLRQRWRNNCLSADFLADYFSTFFLTEEEEAGESEKQVEVQSAVSYIANELLENAMKYGCETSPFPISIQIHLNPELIVFELTNSIHLEKTSEFQAHINQLMTSDPEELYIAQLEKNAMNDYEESGLGFLTMLNDYGAKLGWKFEELPQQSQELAVTTMVQLII